jgi:hypothetical protein
LDDPDLRDNLARARENGVEANLEEARDIADDSAADFRIDPEKGLVFNAEHVQRSKLRVETRIKYAQMIAPRKYGAKLDLTSGGDPIRAMDDTEKLTRLASIFAKAEAREPDGDA